MIPAAELRSLRCLSPQLEACALDELVGMTGATAKEQRAHGVRPRGHTMPLAPHLTVVTSQDADARKEQVRQQPSAEQREAEVAYARPQLIPAVAAA